MTESYSIFKFQRNGFHHMFIIEFASVYIAFVLLGEYHNQTKAVVDGFVSDYHSCTLCDWVINFIPLIVKCQAFEFLFAGGLYFKINAHMVSKALTLVL